MYGKKLLSILFALSLFLMPIFTTFLQPPVYANTNRNDFRQLLAKVTPEKVTDKSTFVQTTHKTRTRIVEFTHELSDSEKTSLQNEYSMKISERRARNHRYVVTPENEDKFTQLKQDSRVEATYNNDMYKISTQTVDWGVLRMNVPTAWENSSPSTGEDIVIALIDTGVQLDHPDLVGAIEPGGYDFVNDDADPTDDQGHGTAMAGAIVAVDNTVGVKGVAFNAKIIPYKVCQADAFCSSVAISDAVDAAVAAHVDVINLSLGGSANSLVQDSIQAATDAGIIVVAASGNDSAATGCLYPGAYENVVCVGSVDNADAHASFSNSGADLDVVTPGVNVTSTAMGSTYGAVSGTSVSTAYYSGVAALVKGMINTLCVSEPGNAACTDKRAYTQALLNDTTIRDVGAVGRDDLFGNGIVDLSQIFAKTTLINTAPQAFIRKGTTYSQPMTITNSTGYDIQVNYCTIVTKNLSRTQTVPVFTVTGLFKDSTLYTTYIDNVSYTKFTFPAPINVANGAMANFSYAYIVSSETQPNDNVSYGFECIFDKTSTGEIEQYRTDPMKATTTIGIPNTLVNVYFTFGKLKYNQTFPASQLLAGDMVYLKNYDPKKLRVTQFFLYDYVKKGNQGFTKTWKTSTTLFVKTNYLIPGKRRYAYVVEFQDIASGLKTKKYFVFYTK